MKNNTIQAFKKWDEIVDYESDETTVTLLNKKGKKVAEFNYPRFTKHDFDFFKAKVQL
jgi:hypothetical protein